MTARLVRSIYRPMWSVPMLLAASAVQAQGAPAAAVVTRDTGAPPVAAAPLKIRSVSLPNGQTMLVVDGAAGPVVGGTASPPVGAGIATPSTERAVNGQVVLAMPNAVSLTGAGQPPVARPAGIEEHTVANGTKVLGAAPHSLPTATVNGPPHAVVDVQVDAKGAPILPGPFDPTVIYRRVTRR